MKSMIRTDKASDEEATVLPSVRAREPVFAAIEKLIGAELLLVYRELPAVRFFRALDS
jgi:hypothetical protein